MKKTFLRPVLIATIFFALFAVIVVSCKKESGSDDTSTTTKPSIHTLAKTYSAGGVTCECDGEVCGANCAFGACCICIPEGYEGGCTCTFGVEQCKTVKPNEPGKTIKSDNIVLNSGNVTSAINWLDGHSINVDDINDAFDELLDNTSTIEGSSLLHVDDPAKYYTFADVYLNVVNAMSPTLQAAFQDYIDGLPS